MTRRALPIAAAGGLLFPLAAAQATSDHLALARLAICGSALAAAAVVDLAEHRIPNRLVLPTAAACAGLTLASGTGLRPLAAGLALVALLLGVSLARPAALGMGDVKLALLISLGLDGHAPMAVLLGLAFAALAGVLLVALRGRHAWGQALPLAPFLTAGALAALLA
jgi:leader peptidase (prepilin peptidase) / N-methyltransferase